MAEQKWEIEVRRSLREEQERLSREAREAAMRPFYRKLAPLIKASTLDAWRAAAKDLEEGKEGEEDQGESDQIKPDQSASRTDHQEEDLATKERQEYKADLNSEAARSESTPYLSGGEGAEAQVQSTNLKDQNGETSNRSSALQEGTAQRDAEEKVGKGESKTGAEAIRDAGCKLQDKKGNGAGDAQNPNPKPQDPNEGGKGEGETPRRRMGPGAWKNTTYYW